MSRTIDSWNHTNSLIFGIINQIGHLTFSEMVTIWIIVISICSIFNGAFDIITRVGFIAHFHRHIIQHETEAIVPYQEMKICVTIFFRFIDDFFELLR